MATILYALGNLHRRLLVVYFAVIGPRWAYALTGRLARILKIEHDEEIVSYIVDTYYKKTERPFRCCQPRDLLALAKNNCQYRGAPPQMDREMLDFAASVYFTLM